MENAVLPRFFVEVARFLEASCGKVFGVGFLDILKCHGAGTFHV